MSADDEIRFAHDDVVDDMNAPRTVQERVVRLLRRRILNGELPAGSRLIQNDIAAALRVSTTPVREALRQLQTEGLVRIDAHRGGVVRGLSEEELMDLLRWRRYLEPEAIRQSMPVSERALAHAREIQSRMRDTTLTDADFALLNRDFHRAIYVSARSKALLSLMDIVMNPVVAYVSASFEGTPALRERSLEEHELLLDALGRNDVDEAVRLQLQHIERPRHEWTPDGHDAPRREAPLIAHADQDQG